MPAAPLDRRRHAYRDDLADAALAGRIAPRRFVPGTPWHVVASVGPLFPRPEADGDRDTEALAGEPVTVFEVRDGWAWGQLARDRYVGYIAAADLAPGAPAVATHKIAAPAAFVYATPTARAAARATLLLGTRIGVRGDADGFFELGDGGFVRQTLAEPVDATEPDVAATAERLLGAPYLWGGKSVRGLDCSALVQLSLDRAGIACPRDTDMQIAELPGDVDFGGDELPPLQRGDLVYWPGHVAMMVDAVHAIHANGHACTVAIEPIADAAARARGAGQVAAAVKRLRR